MSFGDLGKETVCFGEYKCPVCIKQWQSCRAWADYGQKCKQCSRETKAYNLEKLFKYICQSCQFMWNWKFMEQGLKCKNCNSPALMKPLAKDNCEHAAYIHAHRLATLENADSSMVDPSKEHRSDLCEKCQAIGRCCFGSGTFILASSVRSTTSKWTSPQITPDHYSTPKKTISSDSDSD